MSEEDRPQHDRKIVLSGISGMSSLPVVICKRIKDSSQDDEGYKIPLQNPYSSLYKTVLEATALQIARVILKTSDDVSQVWEAAVDIGIVIPVGEVPQKTKERFFDYITIIRDIL